MTRAPGWLVVAALCAACDGNGEESTAPVTRPAVEDAAPVVTIDAAVPLSADGALSAWTAVVERHRVLARRGDRARVVGRVGEAVDGATWLVDESEGDGALAMRVAPPIEAPVGARAIVAGAWEYDGDSARWLWRAARVTIDDSAGAVTFAHPVGLAVSTIDAVPEGASPASAARRKATTVFAVVGRPVKPGDGWPVADAPGGAQVAWLVLPGERETYGGQGMYTDDEQWQLAPGATYVIDVGRVTRPRRALPVLYAAGLPAVVK